MFRNTLKKKTLVAPPRNPASFRWPLAAGASLQTPSYCCNILLQLQNFKAFVGETQKYFAPGSGEQLRH